MRRMRWRPGRGPGPQWGVHDATPDPLVGWGGGHPLLRGTPPSQEPHASRRLDPRAFSTRCSAPRF